MEFDFWQELAEDGEIDEEAAYDYAEELSERFAESPEGVALAGRGGEPGHYLGVFLDYGIRYTGLSPAEMDASDIRETLDVVAEKITSRPEDLDRAIPELESFCDFVVRAFGFKKAISWKRAIQNYAPEFRRAIRDPRRWGMAKSMMMEGLSRGYDLSTREGLDQWNRTMQAELIARSQAEKGSAPKGPVSLWNRLGRAIGLIRAGDVSGMGEQAARSPAIRDLNNGETGFVTPSAGAPSKRDRKKVKNRRKQTKDSRHHNRR